jgi:drug/metabolite transporter (DMT)-like permease
MPTPKRIWIFLAIGIPALSQSANIIRLGDAHPFAIAAWRLSLAALILFPLAGPKLGRLVSLSVREKLLLAGAGVALALHLFAWIASVQTTTVANATLVLAMNPVITALAAYLFFGERASRSLKAAIALGALGVAAVGWHDLAFEPAHFAGDALSMLSSFLFTAYLLIGKRVRASVDTEVYVAVVYGVAGLVGFLAMLASGVPLVDYSGRTWLCFGLMALVPTLIGHTSLNAAVRYLPAARITALTLAEPLLAGTVAFFAFGERVSSGSFVGYAFICASVLIAALQSRPPGEKSP